MDQWRFVLVRDGQQCVLRDGLMLLQLLHAGNCDMAVSV